MRAVLRINSPLAAAISSAVASTVADKFSMIVGFAAEVLQRFGCPRYRLRRLLIPRARPGRRYR